MDDILARLRVSSDDSRFLPSYSPQRNLLGPQNSGWLSTLTTSTPARRALPDRRIATMSLLIGRLLFGRKT
jgi:hypothetical protein